MGKNPNDYVPVIGGKNLSPDNVRADLDRLAEVQSCSEVDRHIYRLMALHPQLEEAFRGLDLANLNDSAKHDLLSEMNDLLGIKQQRQVR